MKSLTNACNRIFLPLIVACIQIVSAMTLPALVIALSA